MVIVFIVGFIAGLAMAAFQQMDAEKEYAQLGVIKLDGRVYKLSEYEKKEEVWIDEM